MASVASGASVSQSSWIVHFIKSSVGAKIVMAVTGLGMFGFLIGHIAGNLQMFLPPEAMNDYAHFLKTSPGLLWPARLGLLGMVSLHIWAGMRLAALNRAARPAGYAKRAPQRSTVFSRTMAGSGMVVLIFIVMHLAHFTLGFIYPQYFNLTTAEGYHDVHSMFVLGFQQPLITGFYVVAMVLLGFHLAHGTKSMFQSLGLNHPKYQKLFTVAVPAIAMLVVIGNIILPLSVLSGFIDIPEDERARVEQQLEEGAT